MQCQNIRTVHPNFSALYRTIINEDKTAQSNLQFLRQRSEAIRFRVPINPRRCYVLQTKWHIRATVEDSEDILRTILTAKAENHATIVMQHHRFLKPPARAVDLHSGGPILGADTFPQCLIAVQDDHLIGSAL